VMSETQARVETEVWEPNPDEPGYLQLVRRKTVDEVMDELRTIVGEYPTGGEEYFTSPLRLIADDEPEWPAGTIIVYAVEGSSEGDYVHVDVIKHDGQRVAVLPAKTFTGRADARAFARRLYDRIGRPGS